MNVINKQYLVNERNQKIAVQLDLHTFEKIEEILENYAFVQLMDENNDEPALELQDAQEYYRGKLL